MASKKKRHVPEVLWRFYGNRARTLFNTILSLIPPSPLATCRCKGRRCVACSSGEFLLRPGDPYEYRTLLTKCFIVVSENAPQVTEYFCDRRWNQQQIVDRTIEMMKGDGASASNVLCADYDQRNHSSTSLELLTSSAWVLLLRRVGDEFMVYLLKYTSIFLPSTRRNYSQVTGSSISDLFFRTHRNMKPKSRNSPTVNRQSGRKRARIDDSESNPASLNSNCACCLRLRMLPNVSTVTGSQVVTRFLFYNLDHSPSAFAEEHILNKLKPTLSGASSLMKDIFSLPDEAINSLSHPCSHNTNCCCKSSKCLYHSLLQLLRELLRKVKRCQHKKLLEKHCPMPSYKRNAESQSNGIEDTSPVSEFIPIQCYCSQKQVVSFIWAVCRNIIPRDLFGSRSSWRILRRNISRFVRLRRFEAFPLSDGMHKLKLSMFPFLSDEHFLCSLNKKIPNRTKVGYNILKRWIFWFFRKLVIPLLQAHFYVTESEHRKQDVLYYRKPIWRKIMDNTVTCSEDQNHYLPVDKEYVRKISTKRKFGFSKVRLLPKGNGVRVLANLKAASRLPLEKPNRVQYETFKPVNCVLRDLHVVLKGIQLNEPEKLGSSVFSYADVYKKLRPFLLSLKNGSTTIPTVFIVVADVCKAFDSVNQKKLLKIMEGLIQNDEYLIKKSHQVTFKKKSLWVGQNLFLAKNNWGKESTKSSSLPGVLVNQGWSKNIKREELLFYLNEHVKRNILKLGSKYYLQGVGIPQGSILSPLLYSFYYGDLEKNVLLPLFQKASAGDLFDHKFILVRFIDDFLFISTSKEQAASFFSKVSSGFPGYNCTMNQMKFGRNFDINQTIGTSANTMYIGDDGVPFLRWSGLFINSRTLEIQADYTRYMRIHIRSSLTICRGGNPRIRLKTKLCEYLRPKCHPIFYDSDINSPFVVRLNIYQAFLLCAMKFHCYFCELLSICRLNANSCFLIIDNSLRFMHKCLKKLMLNTCLDSRSKFQVDRGEVQWLGIKAYLRILRKKESRHKKLLSILNSQQISHEKNLYISSDLKKAIDDLHSSVIWKIKY